MFDLKNIFGKKAKKVLLSKEEIAEFIKIDPEALIKFEESYKNHVLGKKMLSDNFFAINAKQIVEEKKKRLISDITAEQGDINDIAKRIVAELLDCSIIYAWDGKDAHLETFDILPEEYVPVSQEDLDKIPKAYRPELTGYLFKRDISEGAAGVLLYEYKSYLETPNMQLKKRLYGSFRQGLDILDLDPITYKIIDKNVNSIKVFSEILTPNEKKAVILKYGFDQGTLEKGVLSLREISSKMGYSPESVRKFLNNALKKLRLPQYGRCLMPNYDYYISSISNIAS